MQHYGEKQPYGHTEEDLEAMLAKAAKLGIKGKIYNLNALMEDNVEDLPYAGVLVLEQAAQVFLDGESNVDSFFSTMLESEWDKKALFRGALKNKKARWNWGGAHHAQSPDLANGNGTIYDYADCPQLDKLCKKLETLAGEDAGALVVEANFYYDHRKTRIGFHGDAERKKVLAVRFGDTFPLLFQWFYRHAPTGERLEISLKHGDAYVMSAKAVGNDWKSSASYTLRHGAGIALRSNEWLLEDREKKDARTEENKRVKKQKLNYGKK
jgi:alkylated DNA repair dioxygenase AlkB